MASLQHLSFHNRDCKIHYWYRKGTSQRYVMLLHGGGIDHQMFETQIQAFDESFHLLIWDARGHGLSRLPAEKRFNFEDMIADCLQLYRLYDINQAILVGQSMGGNLAQEIAYRYPQKVERLVLIDCMRNTSSLTLIERLLIKLAGPIMYLYPMKTLIKQSAAACSNREDVRQYVREVLSQSTRREFIDIINATMACLHEDSNWRFPQPVLLLCGEDDKSGIIKKTVFPWAESDPQISLHIIDGASHNSNQDQPEVVNRLIAEFVGSNPTLFSKELVN
jgi:pimeloyl-ACP methyl ester carboxylesterase